MQRGIGQIYIFVGMLIALMIAGGAYYLGRQTNNQSSPKACTMEAKICPDGSSVGRTGPNCEFAPCPSATPKSDETANWKTYTNNKLKFQIKYPTEISGEDWVYEELKTIDGSIDHISFGPLSSKQGGYVWGIEVHSNKSVENLIKEQGSQFSDRKESRKNITINGKSDLWIRFFASLRMTEGITVNKYRQIWLASRRF